MEISAFQLQSPLCVSPRNMLATCISRVSPPNYINILKKILLFKRVTDFFRKAKISATNNFETCKQANAYPLRETAYPAAPNDRWSWTRFPFPRRVPPSPEHQQPVRAEPSPAEPPGRQQEGRVLPGGRHPPARPGLH